ncbi:phage tail tip lysozyme [Streptococcus dentiloxodontae]
MKKALQTKLILFFLPILGAIVLILFIVLLVVVAAAGGGAGGGSGSSSCKTDEGKSSQTETVSDYASESDWTTEGTATNKVAKTIWDYLTNELGYSGAGAAGALGNAYGESAFDPTAQNTGGGVAGIFQWSGFSNSVNGSRITSEGSIKAGDVSTLTLENEMKLLKFELTGAYTSVNSKVGLATDPVEAATAWQTSFEGAPGQGDATRQSAAKQAYEAFNGKSVSADKSKIEAAGSSGSAAGGSDGGSGSGSSSSKKGKGCKSSSSGGGTGEWSKDKTGSYPGRSYLAWKKDDLPDELKQYALDPTSLGLGFGEAKGWDVGAGNYLAAGGLSGQCTTFAAATFGTLWSKDGKVMGMAHGLHGNGKELVGQATAALGGKSSKTPTAGAIFSQDYGGGAAGHTGIVSHVFENGDFLVVEQNYTGFSGEHNNQPYTWNYRYVPASQYTSETWSFYAPTDEGYEISENAKSVG